MAAALLLSLLVLIGASEAASEVAKKKPNFVYVLCGASARLLPSNCRRSRSAHHCLGAPPYSPPLFTQTI